MPTHIAGDKEPYYSALEAADLAFREGRVDLSTLERLLEDTLIRQIREAATSPMRGSRPKRGTSGPQTLATTDAAVVSSKKAGWMQEKGAWIGVVGAVLAAVIGALASQCSGTAG